MREPHDHDIPIELHTWIRVATWNLKNFQAAAVREEIIAQYFGKLAAELESGKTGSEARAQILKSLGDPHAAGTELFIYFKKKPEQRKRLVTPWITRLIQRKRPADIKEWLLIVTNDLAGPDRQRVELELTGHYEEALAEARASGLPESGARERALALLGDPWETGRELLETYLSQSDFERLRMIAMRADPSYLYGQFFGLLLCIAGVALIDPDKHWWFVYFIAEMGFVLFLHDALVSAIYCTFFRARPLRKLILFALSWQPLITMILQFPFLFAFYSLSHHRTDLPPWKMAGLMAATCSLAIWLLNLRLVQRLLHKLKHGAYEIDEINRTDPDQYA